MSKSQSQTFQYTHGEELANVITHVLGVLFGIGAIIDLSIKAVADSNLLALFCYTIYGLSLITLYSASSLYHFAKTEKAKKIFKKMDHISIYYLIAGTYTPFLLLHIGGTFGFYFCLGIWTAALLGTYAKFKLCHSRIKLSLFLYLFMGWVIVFAWSTLTASITPESRWWLVFGGLLYSGGTIFYVMKKVSYHHMIWHLFVLAGSVSHYVSIRLMA